MKIAEVKAVERVVVNDVATIELQVAMEGGVIATVEYFSAAGEDSPPMVGDFVALTESSGGSGTVQAVAWQDPKNPTEAADGEKRLYARDSHGDIACEIWLKSDVEAVITVVKDGMALRLKNDNGPIILDSRDVRAGAGAGRAIACVGDVATGICTAPGQAIAVQIISGSANAKAT